MSCKYCTEYEDLPEHVIDGKPVGKVFDTSISEDEKGWHIELPSGYDIGISFCPICGRKLSDKLKKRAITHGSKKKKKRKYYRKCGMCAVRHEQSVMHRDDCSPNGWICDECYNDLHPLYEDFGEE